MSEKKPNIGQSVRAICRRLGVEPTDVRWIRITPVTARLSVYEKNEYGHKYIRENGQPATRTYTVRVKT